MPSIRTITPHQKDHITVRDVLAGPLRLRSLTDDVGMENKITDKSMHRPQLALAGYTEFFTYYRVQLFGNTEFYYLNSLTHADRVKAFRNICMFNVPCIILANGHILEDELVDLAREHSVAILATDYDTTKAIQQLSDFLDDQFAPQLNVHGSFVDVYGVGMLFSGASGIGKSEIALDLVERGHRLVADDIVVFTQKRESILMGTGTSLVKHFMEIRGLGVIDVRQMFGVRAIRFQKRLEIIVELEVFDPDREYNRTGLDETVTSLMGVEIPTIKLPIIPGKNITVISEVIALDYLLKTYGYHASKVMSERLHDEITKRRSSRASTDQRHITYFMGDDE